MKKKNDTIFSLFLITSQVLESLISEFGNLETLVMQARAGKFLISEHGCSYEINLFITFYQTTIVFINPYLAFSP